MRHTADGHRSRADGRIVLALRIVGPCQAVYTARIFWHAFGVGRCENDRNVRERGISFGDAAGIFEDWNLEALDTREDYGEDRLIAVGVETLWSWWSCTHCQKP